MAVFLGPYSPTLGVRVYNPKVAGSSAPDTSNSALLTGTTYTNLFNNITVPDGLLDVSTPCDVAQVDMQKWVCISVVLNGKTLDVYLDGKLGRSCILPNTYVVSPTYNYTFADMCGFGGWLGNSSVYNYALNPEQIWQVYMNGPGPSYSILDYLKSLFNPNAIGSTAYPKING
jgi:hypothetical protein